MFFHEVQVGDSLFTISNRYGVSVDQIRLVNGLEQTNIVPGQALLIPLYTYIVQPNDTFTSISRKSRRRNASSSQASCSSSTTTVVRVAVARSRMELVL